MEISRRRFLQATTAAAGTIASNCQFLPAGALRSVHTSSVKPVLVIVQLNGGNDGLNTVIPYGCGTYYDARPTLALKPSEILLLNGQLGLHSKMPGLLDFYKAGKLAIVLGVGYPNPTTSHFRSQTIWHTAEPDKIVDTGWLGRYLALNAESRNKQFPCAISFDSTMPKILSAPEVSTASATSLALPVTPTKTGQAMSSYATGSNINWQDTESRYSRIELFKKIASAAVGNSASLLAPLPHNSIKIVYPNSSFANALKSVAEMIRCGIDTTVYHVSMNNFDTHKNQSVRHSNLLNQLSDSLTAFQSDLELHQLDRHVITMVYSEFGRRPKENLAQGTDHGTAAPLLLLGSNIKGGIYGNYPSLTDLKDEDLKFSVDFRTVYATIIDCWFNADSQQILSGKFDHLPFI